MCAHTHTLCFRNAVSNVADSYGDKSVFFFFVCFLADIDDMSICYVLKNGASATSDSFSFSIEDNGKSIQVSTL